MAWSGHLKLAHPARKICLSATLANNKVIPPLLWVQVNLDGGEGTNTGNSILLDKEGASKNHNSVVKGPGRMYLTKYSLLYFSYKMSPELMWKSLGGKIIFHWTTREGGQEGNYRTCMNCVIYDPHSICHESIIPGSLPHSFLPVSLQYHYGDSNRSADHQTLREVHSSSGN